MRESIVKKRIARKETCLITSLHLMDESVYEMVSSIGFDCIWIDTEHHFHSNENVGSMIRATRVGDVDVMVRPSRHEFSQIGRFLEMGATGILYPRCSGASEAKDVVAAAKFPPEGRRGYDGANPDMPYMSMAMGDYIETANAQTFVGVQIEDDAALDRAEEIAEVQGVDFIFLGPADYTIRHGKPGQFEHPCVSIAIDRIANAARNAGKAWGCPVQDSDGASQVVELGGTIITSGSDIGVLRRELRKQVTVFRERLSSVRVATSA